MDVAELSRIKDGIVEWLRVEMKAAGTTTAVLGVSGGVDSAVVAGLASEAFGPDAIRAVFISAESLNRDALHRAREVGKQFGLMIHFMSIREEQRSIFQESLVVPKQEVSYDDDVVLGNIAARLRMVALYSIANAQNGIVLGTTNYTEMALGYFTKYGDGGVDVEPLGDLYKSEVYQLAKFIGVPESVIEAAPSADLWDGQTDEEELGGTYDEIDRALRRYFNADPRLFRDDASTLEKKIVRLTMKNAHKGLTPPVCGLMEGDCGNE
jgi:NAD+ synthase